MQYIPILRFRSVENSLLSDEIDNTNTVFPLVEITDDELFEQNISNGSGAYSGVSFTVLQVRWLQIRFFYYISQSHLFDDTGEHF